MRVAVVGAGIGGLTLAAALRRKAIGVQVELYERDGSPFSRPQGYAIGLKHDGGLRALDELGLREEVLAADTARVSDFVFTDQHGRRLLNLAAGTDETRVTYRVQRRHLKRVLLRAAGDTPMYFGRAGAGYEVTGSGALLRFADGQWTEADLIIACDGVGSAIRAQLVGDEPNYLGLTSIYADSPVPPDHPLLAGGYLMSLGADGTSFFAYGQPGGTTHWSYTLHADLAGRDGASDVAGRDCERLLDDVRRATDGWHELVGTLVGKARVDSVGMRGYYDREPLASVHDGPVWLTGDAAHPMCPFQGQGANTAMRDALDIADLISGLVAGTAQPDAVAAGIVARGRKAVLESRRAAVQFHTTSRFRQVNRNVGFRVANLFIRAASRR
jgi:salicylate hydroxylase